NCCAHGKSSVNAKMSVVTSQHRCKTKQKHTCRAMARSHLGDEGVPDVLITRDQSECRRDREVVENLEALLVLHAGARRQLTDAVFEFSADDVVVEARTEAVMLSRVPQATSKQSDAAIPRERIGRFRCVPSTTEHPDSTQGLGILHLFLDL